VKRLRSLKSILVRVSARARALLRRSGVRDALTILAVGIVSFAIVEYWELPDHIFSFLLAHADWQIDDIAIAMIVVGMATLFLYARRLRELSHEIRARALAEIEARRLARHDPLTGLPNRRFFTENLQEALHRLTYHGTHVAVLVLDLDGFKPINDVYGHAAGDRALIGFAERISTLMPSETVVARIGGDEFAVILSKIASPDAPAHLARRIVGAMTEPFVVAGGWATLGVSIGIAIAPDDGLEPNELVRRADLALYRAKSEGRSSIRFFEPGMDAHVERRLRIERDLRSALAVEAIVPHYQPLVSLDGERILGFEALARWKGHDDVPPHLFIAVAEESGLIGELGDQLLRRACLDARHWPAELTLAFNISPVQLCDRTLGLRILSILGDTGLDPRRLELEIIESAIVSNIEIAREVLGALRAAGVRVAIDDFGTGYATLSQLIELRFDKIKIDRSFVARIGKDMESGVIVRAILGLANGFGMTATAEGIEDASQLAFLRQNGCTEGQGFLFSKAVPANEVAGLLGLRSGAAAATG
jgi:diguanylate cyclase (GGDEF)-like protein